MIIWIASYPRSGNTFFRVILNSVFGVNTYSLYNDNADIGADKKTSDIVGHELLPDDFDIEKARVSEQLYLIKTHDYPANDQDKAIYLVRDGRESTLSFIRYKQNYYNTQETLIDVIYGNVVFGRWGDHVAKWNPKNRQNTLLLKFEELVDAPSLFIKKISDFIGVNPKQEGDIPTFEQLNKINPKFFHQGKKDSWKEQYTPDEHLAFWMKNYKQMMEYGYERDKPPAFENAQLVELLSVLSTEYAYQSNFLKIQYEESLRSAQDNIKHCQKLLATKDKQLQESQSTIAHQDQLKSKDSFLRDMERDLVELKSQQKELVERLTAKDKQLQESQSTIAHQDQQLKSKDSFLRDMERDLVGLKSQKKDLIELYQQLRFSKRMRLANKLLSPFDKLRAMMQRSRKP